MTRPRAPDWPAFMRRATAAQFVDMSPAAFERAVTAGELPLPQRIAGEERWSRDAILRHLGAGYGDDLPDWRREQPGLAA